MTEFDLTRLEVGMLDTNCYILKHRESRAAAVIDPGGDLLTIKNALFEADASLRLILLTHGHIDHILALDDLRTPNTIVCIHESDAHMLAEKDVFSSMIPFDPRPMKNADFLFKKTENTRSTRLNSTCCIRPAIRAARYAIFLRTACSPATPCSTAA